MGKTKTYAICGVGIFGRSIIKTLSEYGVNILALDQSEASLAQVEALTKATYVVDFLNELAFDDIDLSHVDVAIVAMGSHLEASVITIKNLQAQQVPYIIAKANTVIHGNILKDIGAHQVVNPEIEMGERIAKQCVSDRIIAMFDIDDDHTMIEMHPLKQWVNQSLKQLDLRHQHQINVLGVRQNETAPLMMSLSSDYIIKATDQLLVVGPSVSLEQLDNGED